MNAKEGVFIKNCEQCFQIILRLNKMQLINNHLWNIENISNNAMILKICSKTEHSLNNFNINH